jgi:hypothetical protein
LKPIWNKEYKHGYHLHTNTHIDFSRKKTYWLSLHFTNSTWHFNQKYENNFFNLLHVNMKKIIEAADVNTKIWYRRESDLWVQPGEKSVLEKEGFSRRIRQRSPRSAICFRSARKLFALILWDCAMTWPERKGRMDG